MTIGVLGTGRIATTLAVLFARAGHQVRLGSADAGHGRGTAARLGCPELTGGSCEEAVARASVVIPAVLGVPGAVQVLRPWRAAVRGKILVDVTNPFTGDHTDFVGPWARGGTADLAAAFPGARLVGAFKNVWWEHLADGDASAVPDIQVVSDDAEAKQAVLRLCAATPYRYADGGGLDQAGRVERMALSGSRTRRGFAA
ncbi:NADPH-dependent F420 reductase [Streptomyces arenae]|uniref:NADPH-dependent F420 reductase n=1 Tax=Streptomyces arenae TaxID=29301 RepID=UPI00265844D5|nr:NAD(P)-binding domain-containing protein [Streptomyces arenae]MCG7202970.1 NAD(P)-binding domain-containing protein [Streptomyces arenae]